MQLKGGEFMIKEARNLKSIDGFDYLDCYLNRPISIKTIFKVMSKNDFELSKKDNYLYFNRVDSYEDGNDGLQLLLDLIGNQESKFETNPNYSYSKFLDKMRRSTFACCFSTIDNSRSHNYGSDDGSGKVCLKFNLDKLINQLKTLTCFGQDRSDQIYLSFGEVTYLDWSKVKLNEKELQNNIKYIFIKDKIKWSHENEFRLALIPNPEAIIKYKSYSGLHLSFDYEQALRNGVIEQMEKL